MCKGTVLSVLILFFCSCLSAADANSQETPNTLAWLQFVAGELRELRRELLEDRLERQQTRVQAMENELNQARIERSDGIEVQRAQAQELVNLEQRIADPAIAAEQRSELIALRTELTAREQTDRANSSLREKQIAERLQREQLRLEALRATARALAPPSTQSKQ